MRYSCGRGADVFALPHQVNCCPRTLELHPMRRQLRMSPRRLGGMPLLSSKGMRMFWTSLSSPGPFPSRRAVRTAGPLHWECVRSACQGPLGALPLARFCSGRCATALRTSRGGPAAVTRTSSCADPFVPRGPEAGHDIRPDISPLQGHHLRHEGDQFVYPAFFCLSWAVVSIVV